METVFVASGEANLNFFLFQHRHIAVDFEVINLCGVLSIKEICTDLQIEGA